MFTKKLLIGVVVIIILIVVLVSWLGVKIFGSEDPAGSSEYSAVYMITGDIYYGKLSFIPRMKLEDVWFLQRGVDPQTQQQQFGLARFTTAFWGPVDQLYLNPDQVLFWTALRNDSQVAQTFRNPEAVQQQQNQNQNQQPPPQGFQGPTGPPPTFE